MGFQIFIFIFGLGLLVWGSNLFVDSAVSLANHLRLPEVLIGATIVSLGTTLPEILFSTMAASKGLSDMALGNALGSILCNTGFIAGLLILLKPVFFNTSEIQNITSGLLFLEIGFLIYFLSGIFQKGLTRFVGIALVCICILYLRNAMHKPSSPKPYAADNASSFSKGELARLILEILAVYLGASLLVKAGPLLAHSMGIPEVVISLTMVALGTSLPELVTSLVALKKEHSSLSLGNIIGADILNFVLVGGASAVICPIRYQPSVMHLELPFIFVFLLLLCVPSILRRKAGRLQGITLLFGYALYLFLLAKAI